VLNHGTKVREVQVPWKKGKEMEKVECPHCGKFCDKLKC
jgi:hypothetical protein